MAAGDAVILEPASDTPATGSFPAAKIYRDDRRQLRHDEAVVRSSQPKLLGRAKEARVLDELVDAVGRGESRVIVVRGDAGIGKTACLDHLAQQMPRSRAVRVSGTQTEMELPFGALQQLCTPLLDQLAGLPGPQRDALGVAFGLVDGPAPQVFLVGLAVLGLLSKSAATNPVLGVIDDAQWLDRSSAQVLSFVARRLLAESVLLAFGVRGNGVNQLEGLPELWIEGLDRASARELLESSFHGRLDSRVVDRIISETRGNPLALVELPFGRTAAELAGGFRVSSGKPVSARVEESFLGRFASLPAASQRLLLLAAADPVGDPVLLWRAAEELGLDLGDASPAEAAELIEFGVTVRFRHPLVRSAIYETGLPEDRRRVHRALANATDPETDPDRRAWHRAQASLAPDEEVASELERSADRARARGGLAAAAAFREHAVALTPDPTLRARRALAAAKSKYDAGELQAALDLVPMAEAQPFDELALAEAQYLRAHVAFAIGRGSDASPLLREAAQRLEPLDANLAREAHVEALWAGTFAGTLDNGAVVRDAAEAAAVAPPASGPPRAIDLLLDGLVTRYTKGFAASAATLRLAREARQREDPDGLDGIRWLWLAADLWDESSLDFAAHQVRLCRQAGALYLLPLALNSQAGLGLNAGEFAAAHAVIQEANSISTATGVAPIVYTEIVLAAWQGSEARTSGLINANLAEATARGDGTVTVLANYSLAILNIGLGRYAEAVEFAQRACELEEVGPGFWAVPELIEAAARAGQSGLAAASLARLSVRTQASATEWALGTEARSRAIILDGDEAEAAYQEAIDRLGRTRMTPHLARAQLLYGEWLRRQKRRTDARVHLRAAFEVFESIGAEAFATRARHELVATGEHARKRSVETSADLTPQERQVANLAAEGNTNNEIAAQMFISASTTEYHLRKVFRKLAITSRRQLKRALHGL